MGDMRLKPERGGWHWIRPFGCGWFIREFLLGHGPEDTRKIDPDRGESIAEIRRYYKAAVHRAIARDAAEHEISDRVLAGEVLTEEQELEIFEKYYRRIPRRATQVRYHSFLAYFDRLQRLEWVEATREEQISDILGGRPGALVERMGPGRYVVEVPQPRRFFRLTEAGKQASDWEWGNPQRTLYSPAWGGPEAYMEHLRENQRKKREEGRRYYTPGQRIKI